MWKALKYALMAGALFALTPQAQAATPADTLVVAKQIDDIISLDPAEAYELSGIEVLANAYDRIMRWMIAVIDASGAHSDMGLRLRQTFIDAGLPEPSLALEARVEGGADAPILQYTIDSVRSLLPAAERAGISTIGADDLPFLEARLRLRSRDERRRSDVAADCLGVLSVATA